MVQDISIKDILWATLSTLQPFSWYKNPINFTFVLLLGRYQVKFLSHYKNVVITVGLAHCSSENLL